MQLSYSNLQYRHWNPGASAPLVFPVVVTCNTPDDVLHENIRVNSRRDTEWLFARPAHDRIAVICGSGPSLKDNDDWARHGVDADVFALNGSAGYLSKCCVQPDYQVILDPQAATADLIGPAKAHLFASQVDPTCFDIVPNAMLWHLQVEGIDDLLPSDHRQRDYTLIGGASSVGTTALIVAYALGYRTIHVYGVDSSYRDGKSHAFAQPMNDGEPCASVRFSGKDYITSLTMKLQAERFPYIARLLEREGCAVHVHGEGLLPDIWNAPVERLSEQEKYQRMWAIPEYREMSPGAEAAQVFLDVAKPDEGATVLDLGCGTGRASVTFERAGLKPVLLDFAENCRDPYVLNLPFLVHDLTQPITVRGDYGFCTDVMEHIPAEDTDSALANIFEATSKVFFSIGTTHDNFGSLINQVLHVNVRDHAAWRAVLSEYGRIVYEFEQEASSYFYVERF